MSEKNIKLMLVEDNKLIRTGIKSLFEEEEGFSIIAEAENGRDAIKLSINPSIDIIILDMVLPDISALSVIKTLQEKKCQSKIIILSSHDEYDKIEKALSLGVYAYVIKDINTDMLVSIVKSVYMGAMWLDPKVVKILRDKSEKTLPLKETTRAEFKNNHANLTQREYEVLKLVVDGKSNNDIAQTLCISEHTAKAHVCNIIQKLLVDDRTQAAVKAIKEGIV